MCVVLFQKKILQIKNYILHNLSDDQKYIPYKDAQKIIFKKYTVV